MAKKTFKKEVNCLFRNVLGSFQSDDLRTVQRPFLPHHYLKRQFGYSSQAFQLPIAFPLDAVIYIVGMKSSSLDGICSSAKSMSRNMCSCHRLSCGSGSKTRSIILSCSTSGCMGSKRGLSNIGHPEHSCSHPRPACFDGSSGSIISRILLFKIRKNMFGTIRSPERQYFLFGLPALMANERGFRLVKNLCNRLAYISNYRRQFYFFFYCALHDNQWRNNLNKTKQAHKLLNLDIPFTDYGRNDHFTLKKEGERA